MGSNTEECDALETALDIGQKRLLGKATIVSVVSSDFDSSGGAQVLEIVLGFQDKITRSLRHKTNVDETSSIINKNRCSPNSGASQSAFGLRN